MQFVKAIEYGNILEIYEYEHSPQPSSRVKSKDSNAKYSDEETKFAKRKDNVRQAQKNFRRLVSANLDNNRPFLISLTYQENMQNISLAYKDYRSFIQAMRYRFGEDFKYIVTPEFQKRGAVHFHALFWGLPVNLHLEERKCRTIASMWKRGYVDVVETDGSGKLSTYLSKYMAKAFTDFRLKNQKAYASSKNITKPVVVVNPLVIELFYERRAEDEMPIIDRSYTTRWLGKCRYRLFNSGK